MNQKTRLRRLGAATALTAAAALALSGCSPAAVDYTIDDKAPSHLEGTVSFYHFFSDREADVIQSVIDDFEVANPDVTVEVHSGQDDEKLRKVISSGGDVDLGLSYSTDIVGNFCSSGFADSGSGAFRDLTPYIERDSVDLGQFSDTVRSYTEFDGIRCTLPVLADVYGLYYNVDLLAAAGFTEPPTTLSELEEMANALTTYNDDGSIKTLGFNPLMGFYENSASHYGPLANATWLDADGRAAIAGDPGWEALIEWQTAFANSIGVDKLQAFTAGLGQEFSADNAFQTGQVAMNLDGEYRTAFIDDQTPDLNYATAPMPVADGFEDLYGAGYITGNIAGIAKGSKNPELAWALLKYLTTDTDAIVKLSNGLKNAPTTTAALESPDLEVSAQFQTFLDIMANPHSATTPPSPLGAGYQQTFEDFWHTYQVDGGDLDAGLTDVNKQIDESLDLVSGP